MIGLDWIGLDWMNHRQYWMKQRASLFLLLSVPTLLCLWWAAPGEIFSTKLPSAKITPFEQFDQYTGNERTNMLDGCYHVYLDMGTNTGVQIRWELNLV